MKSPNHPQPAWRERLGAGWRRLWLGQSAPQIGQPEAALNPPGWHVAWASLPGPHHANQDCAGARWLLGPGGGSLALAVADGVTLAAAGEVAARSVVGYWLGAMPPADPQARAARLADADAVVAAALRQHTPEPGAATGAAAWLRPDGHGWATRVGDCRVLIASRETVWAGERWTVRSAFADQTLGAAHPELFPHPDHPQAQQPSHFVGCQRLGEPESLPICIERGQLLLLASDGLHASLSDADWHRVLSAHFEALAINERVQPSTASPTSPERLLALCNDLIQTAQQLGSEDDITVLVVTHGQGE